MERQELEEQSEDAFFPMGAQLYSRAAFDELESIYVYHFLKALNWDLFVGRTFSLGCEERAVRGGREWGNGIIIM